MYDRQNTPESQVRNAHLLREHMHRSMWLDRVAVKAAAQAGVQVEGKEGGMSNPQTKTVWKFPLAPGRGTIQLPLFSTILHVDLDPDNAICLWAEVFPDNAKRTRTFDVLGTGHAVPSNAKHVGSVRDAPFMWHVYSIT